jgi:hypothetical protein
MVTNNGMSACTQKWTSLCSFDWAIAFNFRDESYAGSEIIIPMCRSQLLQVMLSGRDIDASPIFAPAQNRSSC